MFLSPSLPTTSLLLYICSILPLVLSQRLSSRTLSPYNFTYPPYSAESAQLVSYKDTIITSWTPLPQNKTTTLQIQCWKRNTTASANWLGTSPDYSKNITTIRPYSPNQFNASLTFYRAYNPCRFVLYDTFIGPDVGNGGEVNSGAFTISATSPGIGQVWSLNHTAPMGTVAATMTGNSAPDRFSSGVCWRLFSAGAVTIAMLVL